MRFTPKKIEEILETLLSKEGAPLVKELLGKENVSEFDLARRTKKDIKIIRKMLYTLHNYNLVSFTRKKDKQKGWYIYYWTLLQENIRFNYYKMKNDLLGRLKQQLEEEKNELFFVCPNKCVRLNFDQSMDFEFHCPECGEIINQDDPEERVRELVQKSKELEVELTALKEQKKERRKSVKTQKKKLKSRVQQRRKETNKKKQKDKGRLKRKKQKKMV